MVKEKEDDILMDGMNILRDRMSEATEPKDVAILGDALAKAETARVKREEAKASKKQEILRTAATIGGAILAGAATIICACIKRKSHMDGIDRVAMYERDEDIIFTGKTFGEIEKP